MPKSIRITYSDSMVVDRPHDPKKDHGLFLRNGQESYSSHRGDILPGDVVAVDPDGDGISKLVAVRKIETYDA